MKKSGSKKRGRKILVGVLAFLLVAGAVLYFAKNAILQQLYPLPYYEIVMSESEKNDLDPALVYGMIRAESGFDPNAVSRADAHDAGDL